MKPEERYNIVKIEGILLETKLDKKTYTKNGKEVEAIGGTIKVRVDQKLPDGSEEISEVPVSLFANKITNKGELNPAYEAIERIKNEYISIAAGGFEQADAIRITQGKFQNNDFYKNDKLIPSTRISATFVNKIGRSEMTPKATFDCTFKIKGMKQEVDQDGVEIPNRFQIRAAIPGYNGRIDLVTFNATSPDVIAGINRSWIEGDSVRAEGRLSFTAETVTKLIEGDFGESEQREYTHYKNDIVITRGYAPLEGEFEISDDLVDQGIKDYQARLDASRIKAKAKQAPTQQTNKYADLGF